MRFRQLGSSDLQVSEISLGSWLTYGVGVENDAARACLDRAFELGMNLIDTSNVYGRGAAEEFLGDALLGAEGVPFEVAGVHSGDVSWGHRFLPVELPIELPGEGAEHPRR